MMRIPRVKLRTCLVLVAVSGLLCWAAARVGAWYVRRPTYRGLASYHRSQAEALKNSISGPELLYRDAAYYLPNLLDHPEFDLQKAAPANLRSDEFHPFSGPRSGWTAAVEAQRELVEQLKEKGAFHARMAREFQRASESFLAPTPTEGYVHPLPWWADPVVLEQVRLNALKKSKPRTFAKTAPPSP